MKSLGISVTDYTDEIVKNAIKVKFEKKISNSSYDFSSIDFGNSSHVYRVATLLALDNVDPKSNSAEFVLAVIDGNKFDSQIQPQKKWSLKK